MDAHTAIRSRRTIHRYTTDPVPREVVDRALEAAHMAPCHKLTWPWRFHVVGPQTRARIVEVGMAGAERRKGPLDAMRRAAVHGKLANAGALVVVTQTPCEDAFTHKENYGAVSAAIQNLMLSAHADGYGTKWSTGGVTRDPETYDAMGLSPEADEIVGFIWIGVAATVPQVRRPDLTEVIRELP